MPLINIDTQKVLKILKIAKLPEIKQILRELEGGKRIYEPTGFIGFKTFYIGSDGNLTPLAKRRFNILHGAGVLKIASQEEDYTIWELSYDTSKFSINDYDFRPNPDTW